jgi:SAM-dependent methyltransferase
MTITSTLKASLKSIAPAAWLSRWRRYRFDREQDLVRGQPLEKVFSDIYENNTWATPEAGVRYSSGPGSAAEITRGYEDFVVRFVESRPGIGRIVDIGCGDFQVSGRILARLTKPVDYIGCDIAKNVIAYNQQQHGRAGVSFRHLDVTRDPLPAGDLVTVREVFQHLSNDAIHAALANLARAFELAIVTEAQPVSPVAPNLDIASGYRTRDGLASGVYLDQPPFGLRIIDEYVMRRGDGMLRTVVVAL